LIEIYDTEENVITLTQKTSGYISTYKDGIGVTEEMTKSAISVLMNNKHIGRLGKNSRASINTSWNWVDYNNEIWLDHDSIYIMLHCFLCIF